jgi:hypothetical protein
MGNTYWYSREHFIIKNDLLERLKIDLKYSTSTIMWDGIEIPMKSRDATLEDSYFIHDSPCFVEAAERIKRILDVKYEPADLEEVVANCTHLSEEEKEGLHSLLKKYINHYSMDPLNLIR